MSNIGPEFRAQLVDREFRAFVVAVAESMLLEAALAEAADEIDAEQYA